jgi:hypothetical protein
MGLRYDEEAGQIELSNRVLVEDDASAIGQPQGVAERAWFEVLEVGLRIRKELVLDDGRASAAWLTWCGVEPENNEVPLWLSVNDVDVVRPPTKYAEPQCKHYYTSIGRPPTSTTGSSSSCRWVRCAPLATPSTCGWNQGHQVGR